MVLCPMVLVKKCLISCEGIMALFQSQEHIKSCLHIFLDPGFAILTALQATRVLITSYKDFLKHLALDYGSKIG